MGGESRNMGDKKIVESCEKSIIEQIFDRFDEFTKGDKLFSGMEEDLSKSVRNERRKKSEIVDVLTKEQSEKNEDS